MNRPYLKTNELADLFGLTTKSLLNSIHRERFPVPTYKLGKFRVADKAVVAKYFELKTKEGLALIGSNSF
jgi:predicted DNA-binding transcriptional regulator AlpA